MADAKQYAEWCERHDMNPAHSREAFDDAATLHLLDRAPSPPVAAPADQRINTIADGIFDYQRISEKMPPLDREGFRELIGSAIAQWNAPQPPRPGTAPRTQAQVEQDVRSSKLPDSVKRAAAIRAKGQQT